MDPFSRPSTSSSLGAGSSSGAGSDHQVETSGELEHAVNSIFQYFQCPETADFNPEIISERLAKKAGRQSKKPFSVFYDRVANNREFVEKYEEIKYQNVNEVDPFVRLLVRIREDRQMNESLASIVTGTGEPCQYRASSSSIPSRSGTSASSSQQYPVHEPFATPIVTTGQPPTRQSLSSQAAQQRASRSRSRPQSSVLSSVVSNTDQLLNHHHHNLAHSPQQYLVNPTASHHRSRSPRHHSALSQHDQSFGSPSNPVKNLLHETFSPLSHLMPASPAIGSEQGGGPGSDFLDSSFRSPPDTSASSASTVRRSGQPGGHRERHHQGATTPATPSSAAATSSSNRKTPAYVSRDFHPCDWPKENDCFGHIAELHPNVSEQEQILMQDLLFVLIGIEGKFIRLRRSDESSRYKLVPDPTIDQHLANTIGQILKISYSYSAIVTYVESKVYGLVNQALVAAIQRHMLEYNTVVAQMEDMLRRNDLFLQKMFYMLLPYNHSFGLLRELAVKLYRNKCVGGSVLTALHEKTKSIQGMDNKSLDLFLNLTRCASVRYFDILKTWIYYGEISDPRREFFIEDTHHSSHHGVNGASPGHLNGPGGGGKNGSKSGPAAAGRNGISANHSAFIESDDDEYDDDFGKFNDKYWDQRYRINSSKIPIFLKKYEQIIYKTGKYVSIINKVKALYLKSSRVPAPLMAANAVPSMMSHGSQSLAGGLSHPFGSGHHHHHNHNHQPSINSIAPSETAASYSRYSLNDLLRGMASMQVGGGFTSGLQSVPSLPEVAIGGGGGAPTSLMSSNSSASSSNSGLSFGPAIFTPKPEEIQYSFDESSYVAPIMSAYDEASSQLLHILINESALVETFNAVKHYMLLSMGDFIVHFIRFASKDLCKETDSVVQHRLDSMMGMALGISVAAGDKKYLKEDPHVEFTGKTFLKQMKKIMKPLDGTTDRDDTSPSSSYLLKTDLEDDDDEDDCDDVGLNRSIISDVIEGRDLIDGDRWWTTTANSGSVPAGGGAGMGATSNGKNGATSDGNALPRNSISSQVRMRKQLYMTSGMSAGSAMVRSFGSPAFAAGPRTTNGLGGAVPVTGTGSLTMSQGLGSVLLQQQQQQQQQPLPPPSKKNKLYCYESLMLKFDVPFPLSLIFTQKSIVCYQLLFRYIFLCRYAEMELEESWKDNVLNVQLKQCDTLARKAWPEADNTEAIQSLVKAFKGLHKKAFALRYKMIAFVRNFHYFYAFEVIDPFFAQFISQLTKRGSSLDSVIECHEKFLEQCFSSCFLTSMEVTSIIIKIFLLCIELSHALKDSIDPADHSSMMESSCFFSSRAGGINPYATNTPRTRDQLDGSHGPASNDSSTSNPSSSHRASPVDTQLYDRLNSIYFGSRHKSVRSVKEIVDRANAEFDSLVTKLLKKIYSDNCEYHMMYPFVARLDFNDFYRSKIVE